MVLVIVKLAAVPFELPHGASACLPLPAIVTDSFSSGSMCLQKLSLKFPKRIWKMLFVT